MSTKFDSNSKPGKNPPSNPPPHESNQGRTDGLGKSGRDDPAAPQSTPEGKAIDDGSRAGTGNDGDQSRSAKVAVAAVERREKHGS